MNKEIFSLCHATYSPVDLLHFLGPVQLAIVVEEEVGRAFGVIAAVGLGEVWEDAGLQVLAVDPLVVVVAGCVSDEHLHSPRAIRSHDLHLLDVTSLWLHRKSEQYQRDALRAICDRGKPEGVVLVVKALPGRCGRS